MLTMFNHLKSNSLKSPTLRTVAASAACSTGFVAVAFASHELTEYVIRGYPKEEQEIYRTHFMDAEGCREALRDYYQRPKPK